jgi:hypothetical protein
MANWYLARVELHEYKDEQRNLRRPTDQTYEAVHKAMRKPRFSRITILGDDDEKYRMPDATYEKKEADGENPGSVRDEVRAAVKTAWAKASILVVRYKGSDFKQSGLLHAPQSLIDFEEENPEGE